MHGNSLPCQQNFRTITCRIIQSTLPIGSPGAYPGRRKWNFAGGVHDSYSILKRKYWNYPTGCSLKRKAKANYVSSFAMSNARKNYSTNPPKVPFTFNTLMWRPS